MRARVAAWACLAAALLVTQPALFVCFFAISAWLAADLLDADANADTR